jgi:hypothetical protein
MSYDKLHLSTGNGKIYSGSSIIMQQLDQFPGIYGSAAGTRQLIYSTPKFP